MATRIRGRQIKDDSLTGDDIDESTLSIGLNQVCSTEATTTVSLSLGNIFPNTSNIYSVGSTSNRWSEAHVKNLNVYNQMVVSSTSTNQELIRLQKNDADSRYLVFENNGTDTFEMYLNSFENFTFTTTQTTDDILFRLNGHTSLYMQGFPKEVRIWDSYNSAYNTKINSTLEVKSTATTRSILPETNNTYNIGAPDGTNVFAGVYANEVAANSIEVFQTLTLADLFAIKQRTGDPSTLADYAHIYAKDVSGSAELFVRDEAGNVTQISPHNEEGEWHYFSKNVKTGKVVRINMEKMIRKLEEITGERFIDEWIEDTD